MSNFILRAYHVWNKLLHLGGKNSNEELEDNIVEKKVLKIEGAKFNNLLLAANRFIGNHSNLKSVREK